MKKIESKRRVIVNIVLTIIINRIRGLERERNRNSLGFFDIYKIL